MSRRQVVAVGVAVAAMLAALLPPAWVHATGEEVTLAIQPVDPLSLFRGNYVDLRYDIPAESSEELDDSDVAVYALFADERPGRLLQVSADRPSPGPGQFCLRGRLHWGSLSFPDLEQVYVTPERGREIEDDLVGTDMVAVIKVTSRCRAVIVDVEPEFLPDS